MAHDPYAFAVKELKRHLTEALADLEKEPDERSTITIASVQGSIHHAQREAATMMRLVVEGAEARIKAASSGYDIA